MPTVSKTTTPTGQAGASVKEPVADQDLESIRSALMAGEASGEPQPFDPDEFKRSMRATRD